MKSLLMLVVAAAPFTVRAADLSGAWHLTGAIANVNIDRVWTIRQSDNKIEGPCKNQMGETALSGEVKGADVTWKYQANYQGARSRSCSRARSSPMSKSRARSARPRPTEATPSREASTPSANDSQPAPSGLSRPLRERAS